MARLWSLVFAAIAVALAAHVVTLYVLPLLPILAAVGGALVVGGLLLAWLQRRRW